KPFASLGKAIEVAHKLPNNSLVKISIASGTYDCGGLEYIIGRPCLLEGAGASSTILENVRSIILILSVGYIIGMTVKSSSGNSFPFGGLIAGNYGRLAISDCEVYRNGGGYTNGAGVLSNRAIVLCRNIKCFDFDQTGSSGFSGIHGGIIVVAYECSTSNCTHGAMARYGGIVEKRVTLSGNTTETYQDLAGLVRS